MGKTKFKYDLHSTISVKKNIIRSFLFSFMKSILIYNFKIDTFMEYILLLLEDFFKDGISAIKKIYFRFILTGNKCDMFRRIFLLRIYITFIGFMSVICCERNYLAKMRKEDFLLKKKYEEIVDKARKTNRMNDYGNNQQRVFPYNENQGITRKEAEKIIKKLPKDIFDRKKLFIDYDSMPPCDIKSVINNIERLVQYYTPRDDDIDVNTIYEDDQYKPFIEFCEEQHKNTINVQFREEPNLRSDYEKNRERRLSLIMNTALRPLKEYLLSKDRDRFLEDFEINLDYQRDRYWITGYALFFLFISKSKSHTDWKENIYIKRNLRIIFERLLGYFFTFNDDYFDLVDPILKFMLKENEPMVTDLYNASYASTWCLEIFESQIKKNSGFIAFALKYWDFYIMQYSCNESMAIPNIKYLQKEIGRLNGIIDTYKINPNRNNHCVHTSKLKKIVKILEFDQLYFDNYKRLPSSNSFSDNRYIQANTEHPSSRNKGITNTNPKVIHNKKISFYDRKNGLSDRRYKQNVRDPYNSLQYDQKIPPPSNANNNIEISSNYDWLDIDTFVDQKNNSSIESRDREKNRDNDYNSYKNHRIRPEPLYKDFLKLEDFSDQKLSLYSKRITTKTKYDTTPPPAYGNYFYTEIKHNKKNASFDEKNNSSTNIRDEKIDKDRYNSRQNDQTIRQPLNTIAPPPPLKSNGINKIYTKTKTKTSSTTISDKEKENDSYLNLKEETSDMIHFKKILKKVYKKINPYILFCIEFHKYALTMKHKYDIANLKTKGSLLCESLYNETINRIFCSYLSLIKEHLLQNDDVAEGKVEFIENKIIEDNLLLNSNMEKYILYLFYRLEENSLSEEVLKMKSNSIFYKLLEVLFDRNISNNNNLFDRAKHIIEFMLERNKNHVGRLYCQQINYEGKINSKSDFMKRFKNIVKYSKNIYKKGLEKNDKILYEFRGELKCLLKDTIIKRLQKDYIVKDNLKRNIYITDLINKIDHLKYEYTKPRYANIKCYIESYLNLIDNLVYKINLHNRMIVIEKSDNKIGKSNNQASKPNDDQEIIYNAEEYT